MKILPKTSRIAMVGLALMVASGCQCFPPYNYYANAVDDASDTHLYFDRWYTPRLDLTRMGKPDWNGSFNRFWCRCYAQNGTYDQFDDCNQYPPIWPYAFPSNVMPPPIYRTKRPPKPTDTEDLMSPGNTSPLPEPGAVSSPKDDQ